MIVAELYDKLKYNLPHLEPHPLYPVQTGIARGVHSDREALPQFKNLANPLYSSTKQGLFQTQMRVVTKRNKEEEIKVYMFRYRKRSYLVNKTQFRTGFREQVYYHGKSHKSRKALRGVRTADCATGPLLQRPISQSLQTFLLFVKNNLQERIHIHLSRWPGFYSL